MKITLTEAADALLHGSSVFKETRQIYAAFLRLLETGEVRAAEWRDNAWQVNPLVKELILWGFRNGVVQEVSGNFFDKDCLPLQHFTLESKVRIVPGGSSVRGGAYLAPGVVVMPPSYINIGAYVDSDTMIDSHVLVGSCAQIGKRVHLAAGVMIGGVLEPTQAMPVIVEDDVFIGGNVGVFEGVVVKQGAVIGSGVVLNRATPVFDNLTGKFLTANDQGILEIPERAVIVPGGRPLQHGLGKDAGIQLQCPVLIKYRDAKTAAAVALNDVLR